MKRCSTPLIMREMQVKPTWRCSKRVFVCSVVSNSLRPHECSPPHSLSMEFPRQEYWHGLPFPTSRGSSWLRDQTRVSCLAGGFFTKAPSGEWLLLKRQKYWQGCGGKRTLVHCWWQCKLVQPVLFTVFAVLLTSAKTCPSVGEWVRKMWCVYIYTHTHTHTHSGMGWNGIHPLKNGKSYHLQKHGWI